MDTFADPKMVKDNSANPEAAKVAEAAIWTALDLDEVGDQMKSGLLSSGAVVMGTGRTTNGCYVCDGSSTTHGCNGCS